MAIDMATEMRLSFLRYLEEITDARFKARAMYRDYYDGRHGSLLTDRMRRFLQVTTDQEFCLNAIPIVVDSLAERLTVSGFAVEDDAQRDAFSDWWAAARMDSLANVVHLTTIRDGDGYVLVEWDADAGRPIITNQMAFDGDEGTELYYQDGQPLVAVKRWRVEDGPDAGDLFRANLYFDDRVERYESRSNSTWRQLPVLPEDDYTDAQGNPLGIPIIHFRNKNQGYNYGQSEAEDAIPPQNLLNKGVIDLAAAADVSGFGLLYMLGDNPSGLEVAPGSWVYSMRPPGGDAGVSVGKLPADDLDKLVNVVDSFLLKIAQITRTPTSAFQLSGQIAAEGTQKQQEAGLVSKARNRMVDFGNAWEDVFAVCRRLANVYGGAGMDESLIITCSWKDPESRNERDHLEGLKIKRESLDIPIETVWEEAGYSADQIEIMKERRAEEAASGATSLGTALLNQQRKFDQGGSEEA